MKRKKQIASIAVIAILSALALSFGASTFLTSSVVTVPPQPFKPRLIDSLS